MAEFIQGYLRTKGNEGGYANDINDRGGETLGGISRNNWPKWTGWVLVDAHRNQFPTDIHNPKNWKIVDSILQSEPRLVPLTESFYKANFWDDIEGDTIHSQEVANILFDWAVNSGEGSPARVIQNIVGAKPDGDIGPKTAAKINAYPAQEALPKLLRSERIKAIKVIVQNNPSQRVFMDTWLHRAQNT